MKYFAGLDVSLEETAICVVDESGRIVKEGRAASEPRALYETLRKIDLPLERIGLEACSLTAWLYDGIRAEGLQAICIETRQANAAMKTMPKKRIATTPAPFGADHAHRLVSAGACEEPAVSALAIPPCRTTHGPH